MTAPLISNLSELTQDALAEFKKAAQTPATGIVDDLRKSGVTQATGLVAYDLQAPAKQLFPVLTPLRNKIPRVSGGGGTATNWKAVTAINANKLRGAVPEGKRNGQLSVTVEDKSAPYKSLGLEDVISIEAELAARGFEDIRSTQAQRLLWATMIEEEIFDLGGNYGVALGTPTAPTVTVVNGGGTIADDATGYDVRVVALTLHGFMASSVADGVQGQVTVTTPVNTTFTYGGGSSNKSNATATGAVANGGDSLIRAYTPVVAGAVGYAWYVGITGGNVTLQSITTINSVELTSLTTTHQNVTAITADNSKNLLGYDGILYQAWASGSNAYIKNLATGTPGSGTGLTADNAGGIVEIDEMLQSLWENHRLGVNTIYVNAIESKNITKKILSGTGANFNIAVNQGQGFTAGTVVARYLNKFSMNGGSFVDITIHPNLPQGTALGVTEQLPYPVTNIQNVMEKRLQRDYYQMEWPMRERQYESGVYFNGVLAHYFPPSIAIITNIADK